ncbi:MAG: hypothetical protein ACE5R6_19335 [Candidatus Heimdallarchaeota archaeon]
MKKIVELKEWNEATSLKHNGRKFNLEMLRKFELKHMLDLTEIIIKGALVQEDSRDSHYRLNFPKCNDKN